MGAGFADAALTLLYSAIDTLAFLSAPANTKKAGRRYFIDWCKRYIVLSPHSAVTGIDLYGARCGILHTSSATSELGSEGKAREVWYRFEGQAGVNLMTNTPHPALNLDIEELVGAFGNGSQQFVADLAGNLAQRTIAQERVGQLFSWGILTRAV